MRIVLVAELAVVAFIRSSLVLFGARSSFSAFGCDACTFAALGSKPGIAGQHRAPDTVSHCSTAPNLAWGLQVSPLLN